MLNVHRNAALLSLLVGGLLFCAGCDAGLAPPDPDARGQIRGIVTYDPADAWPSADSLLDLRFVAMRFYPRDTTDFLRLSELVFNDPGLRYFVVQDTFEIVDVRPGTYVFSGVAQRFAPRLTAWRPVALYTAQGGLFVVRAGETTELRLTVNFRRPVPFP